jgi:prepilin-type N-terminal cleavage/methylation domain-containing protein
VSLSPRRVGYARVDLSISRLPSVPRLRRRAFTLIELLNTLSVVAVLGALAMYGFGRYVRHAKTLEALGSVNAIAQASVSFYNESDATQPSGGAQAAIHAMRHFPASSRGSVPQDAEDVRGKRYQSTRADWSPSPWRELNFSIPQPQYYRYSFESSGTGRASVATAIAHGDLDGSGVQSTFRQRISVNDRFEAEVAPTIERENPDE